jgi:hypothetical protein
MSAIRHRYTAEEIAHWHAVRDRLYEVGVQLFGEIGWKIRLAELLDVRFDVLDRTWLSSGIVPPDWEDRLFTAVRKLRQTELSAAHRRHVDLIKLERHLLDNRVTKK